VSGAAADDPVSPCPPPGVSGAAARAAAVTVVSLNTALDRTVSLDRLVPGAVHLAGSEGAVAGGKALNVARVAAALGLRVRILALVGGETGRQVRRLAAQEGLLARWVTTVGETRVCTILVDGENGATVVNGRGPEVRPEEVEALAERLWRRAAAGDTVVLTGSVPPGVPEDLYGEWVRRCRSLGAAEVVLDASGPRLTAGVAARPDVVKVNVHEFAVLAAGRDPLEAARDLVAAGVRLVVVTRGAHGAFAVSPQGAWLAEPPPVRAVNPTGSGDAFLAALLDARSRALDLPTALAWASAAGALNAAQLMPGVPDREAVRRAAEAARVRPWRPAREGAATSFA
jgi:1-phosphofructokinase family hexose kinase